MITVVTSQVYRLTDKQGVDLGTVTVDEFQNGNLTGQLIPGPSYAQFEKIFQHFAEVVDQQAFTFLDEAEEAISRLGLVLIRTDQAEQIQISDVQIYPDGLFSCRITPLSLNPELNGQGSAH